MLRVFFLVLFCFNQAVFAESKILLKHSDKVFSDLANLSMKESNNLSSELRYENSLEAKKFYNLLWSTGFQIQQFQTTLAEQESGFQGYFLIKLDYVLHSWLKTQIHPIVLYKSTYLQVNPERNLEKNSEQGAKLSIQRAVIEINPSSAKWFNSSLGIQKLDENHSSLLVGSSSWTAINTQLDFPLPFFKNISLGFGKINSIIESKSLNQSTKTVQKTPSFDSTNLFIKFDSQNFLFKSSYAYFRFLNLPSSFAKKNSDLGNTTYQLSSFEEDIYFMYDFEGQEIQLNTELKFRKDKIGLEFTGLKNVKAIKDYSEAYSYVLYYGSSLSKNIEFSTHYKFFMIQPDACVSSLSQHRTNRIGQEIGIDFAIDKKYKLSLAAIESEVLFERYPQSHDNKVYFKLETSDAIF